LSSTRRQTDTNAFQASENQCKGQPYFSDSQEEQRNVINNLEKIQSSRETQNLLSQVGQRKSILHQIDVHAHKMNER